MRNICFSVLLLLSVSLTGCRWQLKSSDKHNNAQQLQIERYDRIETLYLTTGDYGALTQMNTMYPSQTMTLVENVLQLGKLDEPGINERFYEFFQDSTLQQLIADVQKQYENIDDINKELSEAFMRIHNLFPYLRLPRVYTQVTALDQSIIIGNGLLAISLDKYLGTDYPLYLYYGYNEQQRSMMTREFIVPDCVGFYLISIFPHDGIDHYRPRLQHFVNEILGRKVFNDEEIMQVERYMKSHQGFTLDRLLTDTIHII